MTEDLCELRIIGTVTSDVEVKTSASGTHWLSLSVESVVNGYKTFNRLMAFKEMADKLTESVKKDNRVKILANCRLSKNSKTNNWETQLSVYKFEVLKDDVSVQKEQPSKEIANGIPSANADELPF